MVSVSKYFKQKEQHVQKPWGQRENAEFKIWEEGERGFEEGSLPTVKPDRLEGHAEDVAI